MNEFTTSRMYTRFVGCDKCPTCGVDAKQPCIDRRYVGKSRKIGFGKNQQIVPITKERPHRGRPRLPVDELPPPPPAERPAPRLPIMLCTGYDVCPRCEAPRDEPCLNMHYLKKYPKDGIDLTQTPQFAMMLPHRDRPKTQRNDSE